VDDDPDMARLVSRLVHSWRRTCEVRTALDGESGLRALRESPADMVLLDLVMPGLDGYGFLAAIRQEKDLAGTPVVVISGAARAAEHLTATSIDVCRAGGLTVGEAVRCVRASLDALLAAGSAHTAPARSAVPTG
jgi:CheY-like chemotaxis protein